jgi:hypothetical protein
MFITKHIHNMPTYAKLMKNIETFKTFPINASSLSWMSDDEWEDDFVDKHDGWNKYGLYRYILGKGINNDIQRINMRLKAVCMLAKCDFDEDFIDNLYENTKQDGDWVIQILEAGKLTHNLGLKLCLT